MTTSTRYFDTKEQYLSFRQAWRTAANDKSVHLTAEHFMLYNIIRGKDPQSGFSPFQRMSKIIGMGRINLGVVMAAEGLTRLNKTWFADRKKDFLAPFGNTFTAEDFDNMVARGMIPDIPTITPTFGKGRQILQRIQSGDIAPKTCIELMAFYNEDVAKQEAA